MQEDVVEMKLWDKVAALALLFKHLGLSGTKKVNVTLDEQVMARLNAAPERLAKKKSEDFQHDQMYDTVRAVNPCLASPETTVSCRRR